MKKRVLFVLVIAAVLMSIGCGNSESAEKPIGADSPMTENEPDELFTIVQHLTGITENFLSALMKYRGNEID